MGKELFLDPDRLLPAEGAAREHARALFDEIAGLPIVSPHGHTDPEWFAKDTPFSDPASLFLIPDHYVLRMLRSRGLSYDKLGVPRRDGGAVAEPGDAWRLFAANFHLFAGTPSELWIGHALNWAFGISERLDAENADRLYELISSRLADPDLRPRAILDKARVEVIATTDGALDPLVHHLALSKSELAGRVVPTYRPDSVTDPDAPGFADRLLRFGELTGTDVARWDGMLDAHRSRRAYFRSLGATATDHGTPTAQTADLSDPDKQALLDRVLRGNRAQGDAALFRAQMLTEMAGLSAEDGMVMQIHAGAKRGTDPLTLKVWGPDKGADIPVPTDFVNGLQPLLSRYGNAEGLNIVLFTLDETAYARELAPMAGFWPSLSLGPPWWFHDSPNGIARYFDQVFETAGAYNLAGFNDDTRALLSIPARHDVWRRCVARFLGQNVAEHRIGLGSARELARHLAYDAARKTYRL